mmetsp:Transcript_44133/g.89081  ORF Transcript_44133/g.89081 Transcript_44133/m.89081 type:complete len:347 (+) Transcript_44133:646-1686(+)
MPPLSSLAWLQQVDGQKHWRRAIEGIQAGTACKGHVFRDSPPRQVKSPRRSPKRKCMDLTRLKHSIAEVLLHSRRVCRLDDTVARKGGVEQVWGGAPSLRRRHVLVHFCQGDARHRRLDVVRVAPARIVARTIVHAAQAIRHEGRQPSLRCDLLSSHRHPLEGRGADAQGGGSYPHLERALEAHLPQALLPSEVLVGVVDAPLVALARVLLRRPPPMLEQVGSACNLGVETHWRRRVTSRHSTCLHVHDLHLRSRCAHGGAYDLGIRLHYPWMRRSTARARASGQGHASGQNRDEEQNNGRDALPPAFELPELENKFEGGNKRSPRKPDSTRQRWQPGPSVHIYHH